MSKLSPSIPEAQAKQELLDHIGRFVLERIVIADEVIVRSAQEKVEDGDVLLVYARYRILSHQHSPYYVVQNTNAVLIEPMLWRGFSLKPISLANGFEWWSLIQVRSLKVEIASSRS